MSSARCGVCWNPGWIGRASGQFVQVLRLLETFSQREVAAAAKERPPAGSHQLRRRGTLAAVPAGGTAAPAGPGAVSLPAMGTSEHHVRRGLHDLAVGEGGMNDRSTLLLEHHLKELKLSSFLREYEKMAAQCAAEGVDHPQYLLRLAELELIDRHQRMMERRTGPPAFLP